MQKLLPYPPDGSLSQFGTVSYDSYQQAVTKSPEGLLAPPFVVQLFTACLFRQDPEVSPSTGVRRRTQDHHAGYALNERFRVPFPAGGFGSSCLQDSLHG